MKRFLQKILASAVSYVGLRVGGVDASVPIEVGAKVAFGDGVTVRENVRIRSDATIHDNVTIGPNTGLVGDDHIRIHKHTNLVRDNAVVGDVTIGKYCAIAAGASFRARDHRTSYPGMQNEFYEQTLGIDLGYDDDPITVGNDVWIGEGATILAGVEIGDGAVIGANSVVTDDVRPYEVVAGTPAEHIRWRFPEQVRDALDELEWWNYSDEVLQANTEFFSRELTDADDVPDSLANAR